MKLADRFDDLTLRFARAFALLGVLVVVFAQLAGSPPTVVLPWIQPAGETAASVAALAVCYLSLTRHRLEYAPTAFWLGIAFGVGVVFNVFYILTFPSLAGAGSVLLASPSASGYFFSLSSGALAGGIVIVGCIGNRRWAPRAAWPVALAVVLALVSAVVVGVGILVLDRYLPTLVDGGSFTATQTWIDRLIALTAIVGMGLQAAQREAPLDEPFDALSVFSARRPLLIVAALVAASTLTTEFPIERYDLAWYANRIVRLGIPIVMLVSLLHDYGVLYRMQRRLTRENERLLNQALKDAIERKRSEQYLARLTRQQDLILDSVEEGIIGLDRQGKGVFANAAASRLTGYAGDELVGQDVHALVHHTKADGSRYPARECPSYQALVRGVSSGFVREVCWRKDGSSFPIELASSPMWDGDDVVGVVVTFRDLTERLVVERMKDEFVSTVSHELRTPLTAIRGTLGLLSTGKMGALAPQGQRIVGIGVSNCDRLIRLLNDILDLDRLESGQLTLRCAPADAAHLVATSVEALQPLAQKSDVVLRAKAAPAPLLVDADRIVQTLTNLIGNAIKFSPAGSTIQITVEADREEVLFQVRDQGRGIPPDQLHLVFERFRQVDATDSREKGGTGLGLAICRAIVEQHRGRIWVESTLGEGSTFSFSLPCLAVTAFTPPSKTSSGASRSTAW